MITAGYVRPQEETHDMGFLASYPRVKNHGKEMVTLAIGNVPVCAESA